MFVDKLRALELLGKHLGLFSEKREIRGGAITVEVVTPDEAGSSDD
jgi:hypothetical protein